MGLRDRAQQQHDDVKTGTDLTAPKAPVSLFESPRWGIVDGELVEINGIDPDRPGMSPAYLCSDPKNGWSAFVSIRETRYFNTPSQALDAMSTMGRTSQTSGR